MEQHYAAGFSDTTAGENLDLTVEAVNEAVNVPEPSSLALLAAGLIALALLLHRSAAVPV